MKPANLTPAEAAAWLIEGKMPAGTWLKPLLTRGERKALEHVAYQHACGLANEGSPFCHAPRGGGHIPCKRLMASGYLKAETCAPWDGFYDYDEVTGYCFTESGLELARNLGLELEWSDDG